MSSFYFYPDFLARPLNRCIHLQEKAKRGAHMHFKQMVASPSRSALKPKTRAFHINPEVGNKREWKSQRVYSLELDDKAF